MSSHNQNPSLKVHGRVPLPPSITRRAPLRACRGQIVLMASAAWYPIAGWVITSTKESEFLANHSKNDYSLRLPLVKNGFVTIII
jgi:hypothetical protein